MRKSEIFKWNTYNNELNGEAKGVCMSLWNSEKKIQLPILRGAVLLKIMLGMWYILFVNCSDIIVPFLVRSL